MRLTLLKFGTALSAVAFASTAYAETDEQGVGTEGDNIVVRGRVEANDLSSLRDVPKPVSLVSETDLKVFDLVSLPDALSRLSNVRWNDGNPRTGSFSLRGLTAGAGNDKIDPSVGLTIDGVPYAYLAMAAGNDLVDIEQVNVTRGPQGTLGARHTSVGQINVITRRPSFTPDASASLTLGENNTLRAQVQGGGPIIDGLLAFRITATRNQQDGHWWNQFPDVKGLQSHVNTDRTYGRVQLLLTPAQGLSVRLLYDHQPNGSEFVNGLTFRKETPDFYANGGAVNKSNDAIAKLNRRWFTQQSAYTADDYYDNAGLYLDSNRAITTGGKGALGDITYDFGNHTASWLSSWREHYFLAGNDDGTPFDISKNGGYITTYWQHSHEAKLTGQLGGGFVDYTAGLFYLRGEYDSFGSRTRLGNDAGAWNANVQEYNALDANSAGRELLTNSLARVYRSTHSLGVNESKAAFVHADWHLSRPLTLTTGFRISREKRSLNEGVLVYDEGYGSPLNPVNVGAVQFGGFNSVGFVGGDPYIDGVWNPERRDGQLAAGNTAAQLALADTVAQQYFGIAPTANPGEAYNSLTNEQFRQVAAAKAIRLRTFGTLWDYADAEPWEGNIYTGQVGLRNEFSRNLTGYATIQYGEKPGFAQFNGLLPDGSGAPRNLTVDKEKTTTFEIGVRTNWLDGDLVFNANVFRADVRDFQQNVFFFDELLTDLNNDGTLYYSSGVGNVEKVRSQGVEVDFVYDGIRHLSLRFSGAYTDAKYIDHQFSGQPSENANLSDRFRDVSGFTLNNAPKVQFNATANYRRPVSDRFDVHAALSYSYSGKENGDSALSSYGWNDAYGIVDLSVGIGRQDGLFDVSFIARNLLNEDRGDAGWSSYTIYQRPRWLGVAISSKFL